MAKDVCQIAYNNFDFGTPDYLFWAVDTKVIFPVRMVQSGEARLAAKELSTRDDSKESLVEYITYPHNRTRGGMGWNIAMPLCQGLNWYHTMVI